MSLLKNQKILESLLNNGHNWSVWLLPGIKDKKECKGYIKLYSGLYNTPLFDPHVTLFGRLNIDPEPTYAFFNQLKSELNIEKVNKYKYPDWRIPLENNPH